MVAHKLSSATPGLPVADSYEPRGPISRDGGKRIFDLAVALGLCTVALPLIAVMWALVRATSSGPGFYSQVRVGRGGRRYRIYKIRTMQHNCEAKTGVQWAKKRDARVTAVGRVLRKLHLDELPQLWNVLRGDMSLVGPRPERPEFVGPLMGEVDGYAERHRVRPGVTGLAQIQLPADSDVESVRRKLVLDRHYVENAGLWLDLRIMLGTVIYLVGFPYPLVRRAVRLPNPLVAHSPADGAVLPALSILGPVRVMVAQSERAEGRIEEAEARLAAEGGPLPCDGAP